MSEEAIDALAFDIAKMTGFGWECVCQFDKYMQYVCLTCRLKKYLRTKIKELELAIPAGWPKCECGGYWVFEYDEPFADCSKCHVTCEAGNDCDIWREAQKALESGVVQKKKESDG